MAKVQNIVVHDHVLPEEVAISPHVVKQATNLTKSSNRYLKHFTIKELPVLPDG